MSLKRPSYFFIIVFLVDKYKGHFFCNATCSKTIHIYDARAIINISKWVHRLNNFVPDRYYDSLKQGRSVRTIELSDSFASSASYRYIFIPDC